MAERCTGVNDDGNRCRRAPWHVREGFPHRWWASHGNVPPSEWTVTDDEMATALEQQIVNRTEPGKSIQKVLKPATVAASPIKPITAFMRVKGCLACPLFDATLDRCQHPAQGKFGHDVSVAERDTIPIFCPLKHESLTIEAAA